MYIILKFSVFCFSVMLSYRDQILMISAKQSNDMIKSYEGESVNRSQMVIKHVILEPEKTFISRHILHQH
jgi:hypothetical protein